MSDGVFYSAPIQTLREELGLVRQVLRLRFTPLLWLFIGRAAVCALGTPTPSRAPRSPQVALDQRPV